MTRNPQKNVLVVEIDINNACRMLRKWNNQQHHHTYQPPPIALIDGDQYIGADTASKCILKRSREMTARIDKETHGGMRQRRNKIRLGKNQREETVKYASDEKR